jgi:hypothetical protein
MSCENVQKLISPLLDQRVPAGEQENALAHIESCRQCGAQFESMQNVRAALRAMNHAPMPDDLNANLRVMASHERERQLSRATLASRMRYWSDRVRLWSDHLMRPLFLPLAGGLLSAAIIFCVLVPTLSFQHEGIDSALTIDPYAQYGHRPVWGLVVLGPSGAFSPGNGPTIEPDYANSPDDTTVVWLAIGENGKVQDYKLAKGQLTSDMIEIISTSKFNPTFLGAPTAGLVKMVQRRTPVHRAVRS